MCESVCVASVVLRLCATGPRQDTAGGYFSLPFSPSPTLILPLHLHRPHSFPSSGLFYGLSLHFFNFPSHLCTQLFPLSVKLFQLLLQQCWVAGCDALGQVRLHGGQFPQSTGQMLQRELWPLNNTHTCTETLPCSQTAMSKLCDHASLPLTVQIKGLWMGQGEGRGGRKGEGS